MLTIAFTWDSFNCINLLIFWGKIYFCLNLILWIIEENKKRPQLLNITLKTFLFLLNKLILSVHNHGVKRNLNNHFLINLLDIEEIIAIYIQNVVNTLIFYFMQYTSRLSDPSNYENVFPNSVAQFWYSYSYEILLLEALLVNFPSAILNLYSF